ncbi:MAG: acyl carrier protein, partial [Eubacteriales bacterium]|nr:acyl carrier protein [Eubacteriales bacterium]
LEKICQLVSDQFLIDVENVTAETSFVDDLGADSLDVVELTMALEEEFSLPETSEDALNGISTVGDLAAYVSRFVAD